MSIGTTWKRRVTEETSKTAASNVDVSQIPTNLPPRDPKFVGRFTEIDDIRETLAKTKNVALTQPPVPHKDGGVGKTSLAIAYGWAKLAEYPGGVFFLQDDAPSLMIELARLSDLLELPIQSTQRATAQAVINRLASGPPSLLIVDNVAESQKWYEAIRTNVIPEGNCHRLITTQRTELECLKMMTIGRLQQEQSVRMLAEFRQDAGDAENESLVGEVIDVLGGLPLGLATVGAFLAVNQSVTLRQCVDRLKQRESTAADAPNAGTSTPNFQQSVNAVIEDVVTTLPIQHRLVLELASLLCHREFMTKWLVELLQTEAVRAVVHESGQPVFEPTSVVSDLIFLQLLRSLGKGHKSLTMHPRLRARLHERCRAKQFALNDAISLVVQLADRRSHIGNLAVQKSALRAELSPLLDLAEHLHQCGRLEAAVKVVNQLAPPLHSLGRDAEAVAAIDRFKPTEIVDQLPPAVGAVLLSNKAAALTSVGDLRAAHRYMEHALQIERQHLPAGDPALAIRHSNLAGILKTLGELDRARQHIKVAIAIEERHHGPEHLTLGLRRWWLADIESAAGNREEALSQYEHAREIMSKHLPSDHPQFRSLVDVLCEHREKVTIR